ncbi:hypothetical protein BJ170DRAFT_731604 [Xylariales sp. AK1849]|nr:hypothetical protein BJ170DRAFT_731604 [Xylariales sp. AK1849]
MDILKTGLRYTTAGTIYNPTPTPLQAPARSGRTVKWPLHPDFGMPKSSLPGFSLRTDSHSPPAPANHPPRYSPLQQNYDRAVSPTISFTNQEVANMTPASSLPANAESHGKSDDTNLANDADGEDAPLDEDENLRQMSVKTLTNLASYPNPMQKKAQKVLSRARTLPMTTLRSARSDPAGLGNLLQSDGTNDYDMQPSNGTSYSSILSTGLGAPQPLTAGPPGQRKTVTHFKDTVLVQPSALYSASRPNQYPLVGEPTPLVRKNTVSSVQTTLGTDKDTSSNITDTLTAEEARQYYPTGLPSNFNYRTEPTASDRIGSLSTARSQDDIWAHRNKIDTRFYAGNEMLTKSIDQAIREKNRHDFEHAMDLAGEEKTQSKGKIINRKISIEEANAMATSEHVAPLLSMAFQTLINHPELSRYTTLPKFDYRT